MEYSGPEPLINIEADLALSEDDDLSQEHWPKLNPPRHRKLAPTAAVPQPMDHATISTKFRMEPDSDSSSESPSPVAKSSKSNKTPLEINTPVHHLPRPANQRTSTMPAPATPAFAPRSDYVKLLFRDNPGVESVTTLAEKLDIVVTRLEKLDLPKSTSPNNRASNVSAPTPSTSVTSNKKGKLR
ncbi:hypothetical protein Pcinc_033792 [Petrolisthes cinctipes]|uniref:Uncharacterized protein n=1 Tax=Petrolisthes cinctipes TaxID=88211 RepID=A0AAE1ERL7_PETCI|nr:hypothetical protein Pcinc_033792 [Petrolisthes cinctipes]